MPSPFPGMDPYLEQHWGDIHHALVTYARDRLRDFLPGDLVARLEERVFDESAIGREEGREKMPSPFPGMDPYLEQHWGDIHHRLVTYGCDQLHERLPGGLLARMEERVFVESSLGPERAIVPDLRVFERRGGKKKPATSNGALAVAEPLVLHFDEPAAEGFIEIREAGSGRRLVTVVEVLSLTNKVRGEGRDKYLRKQEELRDGGVSLVEIDLLRAGGRVLPVPVERLPQEYRTAYQVCARRGWRRVEAEVYKVPLRERLPVIGIPLRETDDDAPLDLQALIDQCYRNGGYDEDADYERDPDPPLDRADARWADDLLRRAGRRERPRRRKRSGG